MASQQNNAGASAIADLIQSTPELRKKLADKIVVQLGQRFLIIDPAQPGLHVFSEGKEKGKVFQSYQPVATLDAKGNEFVPTPRGTKGGKKSS